MSLSTRRTLDAVPSTRQDDWRALALLTPYRLLLVAILLALHQNHSAQDLLGGVASSPFYLGCALYTAASLGLHALTRLHRPALHWQAHLNLLVDASALSLLVFAAGGIASGLGVLLLPSIIASGILLRSRLAALHAATATLALFGAELMNQLRSAEWDINPYSQVGLVGMTFFAAALGASFVGQRARRSEALAVKMGREYLNLSRLSENIISAMHSGVVVVDAQQRVYLSNLAAQRLLGDDLQGALALPRAAPALHAAWLHWQREQQSPSLPIQPGPQGREVLVRFIALGWGDQAPTLIMLDDAAALREQAQQIKLAALGRLSASIAHEIRNPLAAISQAGQLLAESPARDAQDQHLLAIIERHTGRIDRIVASVLDLSRHTSLKQHTLALRDWLAQTARLYHESQPQQHTPITLTEVGADLHVRFDPEQLQQVLFNLWDNSFAHAAEATQPLHVTLRARRNDADNSEIWLDVIDNGPGIEPGLEERIFEPFFSATASGTGLGLFLCQELCAYNQAHLSLLPSASGAHFRLRLRSARRLDESR